MDDQRQDLFWAVFAAVLAALVCAVILAFALFLLVFGGDHQWGGLPLLGLAVVLLITIAAVRRAT